MFPSIFIGNTSRKKGDIFAQKALICSMSIHCSVTIVLLFKDLQEKNATLEKLLVSVYKLRNAC